MCARPSWPRAGKAERRGRAGRRSATDARLEKEARMDEYVERLEEAVRRFAGPPVLELIRSDPGRALEPYQKNVAATLFFMDLKSFSRQISNLSPGRVFEELNLYFARTADIIVNRRGLVNSLIGDAIFAIFGLEGGPHADDACAAALECRQALASLNDRPDRALVFEAGIGINTGVVLVGNIGSRHKMKFTAIGDMVNLASRMESLTGQYQADILITASTKKSLAGTFTTKELGRVPVKGLGDGIAIYSLEA
jgi:adenylate cyclase